MLNEVFKNIIISSGIGSGLILLIVFLSKVLDKNYKTKWRYWIWLVLSIYLLIPIDLSMDKAIINIEPPEIIVREIGLNSLEDNDKSIVDKDIEVSDNKGRKDDFTRKKESKVINSRRKFDKEDIAIGIWLLGLGLFLAYHTYIYRKFRIGLRLDSKEVADRDILDIYNNLKDKYKIRKDIDIKINGKIKSPVVIGLFKKELLLPSYKLNENQIRLIISHELVHIKRKDILYKFIILLARGVHWFNPLVHMMGKKANEDIEITCDLEVVKNMSLADRKNYSNTILDIAGSDIKDYIFTSNFSGGKNSLKNRFKISYQE